MEITLANGCVVRAVSGDITRVAADAIVNAANSALAGGGGVDGAIHRAGGPSLMDELDAIRASQGGCPTGSAVATGAGKLAARYVFHAVGPIYRDGAQGEPRLLASCYRSALVLARERDVKCIAFPAISTGVYGYPVEEAAGIAVATVCDELLREPGPVKEAIFVLFGAGAMDAYGAALKLRLGKKRAAAE